MMEAALVAVPHLPGVSRRPGVPPRLNTAQALISRVRAIMAGGFDLADTNIYSGTHTKLEREAIAFSDGLWRKQGPSRVSVK